MSHSRDFIHSEISKQLRRLGRSISVPIKRDEDGYVGRQCPVKACLGYYKVTPGTGVKGKAPCHCPYCGYKGDQNKFWTPEQIQYALSVAKQRVSETVANHLRSMQFSHVSRGLFNIGVKVTVENIFHQSATTGRRSSKPRWCATAAPCGTPSTASSLSAPTVVPTTLSRF